MKNFAIPLDFLSRRDRDIAGPAAWQLKALARKGFCLPKTLCVTTHAYADYVDKTGLKERILMELNRKNPRDLLWEEMWDASLRIRSMFLSTPMPLELRDSLKRSFEAFFGQAAVALRPGTASEEWDAFGGDFLSGTCSNISGSYSILDRIKLVWAASCTDSKSLAFRDLGSAPMAVLVQEMVPGHAHGTALCTSPGKNGRVLVQCFPAQGLTGIVPGRWIIEGGRITALPGMDEAPVPGFGEQDLLEIAEHALAAMEVIGSPQEIEWTLHGRGICILGTRTLRRGPHAPEGRFFKGGMGGGDEMRRLRDLVEKVLIPGLTREADAISSRSLERLSDGELSAEARARREARAKWAGLCRDHVMPLAYAAVAFGHMYNDAVRPVEPYEFVDLLLSRDHPALQKDRLMEEMADLARRDAVLLRAIRRKVLPVGFDTFTGLLGEYLDRFGQSSSPSWEARAVLELVLRLAQRHPGSGGRRPLTAGRLTEEFLASLPGERRACAVQLLELARAACRLQGEAGAQMRRIERQEEEACAELRRRLGCPAHGARILPPDEPWLESGGDLDGQAVPGDPDRSAECMHLSARQLAGRPYSSGLATGPARVIRGERDLSGFRAGEIMICDSLEPGMTAIVPLADAVVVEKGAMPREGAAIARKYGLPYVAGVSDATRFIHTGTKVTVDGHLGIVIIEA